MVLKAGLVASRCCGAAPGKAVPSWLGVIAVSGKNISPTEGDRSCFMLLPQISHRVSVRVVSVGEKPRVPGPAFAGWRNRAYPDEASPQPSASSSYGLQLDVCDSVQNSVPGLVPVSGCSNADYFRGATAVGIISSFGLILATPSDAAELIDVTNGGSDLYLSLQGWLSSEPLSESMEAVQVSLQALGSAAQAFDSFPPFQLSVPTNEAIFSMYSGIFSSIAALSSAVWAGLKLSQGGAAPSIAFYASISLLLLAILNQPRD